MGKNSEIRSEFINSKFPYNNVFIWTKSRNYIFSNYCFIFVDICTACFAKFNGQFFHFDSLSALPNPWMPTGKGSWLVPSFECAPGVVCAPANLLSD